MCGLAGVVRRDGSPINDPAALGDRLSRALAHRGPDSARSWASVDRDVLMVHRRLAIIDLSPDGAQPMASPDGRFQLVFNGEVYNYRELRADLESRGERFRTSSDTEVLLRLLALDGPDALAHVRGMFALASWDTADRALLLARDRFGIKPLYVASSGRRLAFASELSALLDSGLVDHEVSASGVAAFLSWGSVPPPLTWLRGAEMLPAGCWWQWRQDGHERRGQFADARQPYLTSSSVRRDLVAWRESVGAAFRDSVRAHLVADVPVGVFLSGGIDSGAIVSAATSVGATNLQTFTVGFQGETSESARAKLVADHFGTRHHDLKVEAANVALDLPQILRRLDQPSVDAVNTYYVSRAVAATGIKAVLSGTGGDEVFGGYPSFSRLPRAMSAKRIAGPFWPLVASAGSGILPDRLQARWRHFAWSNGSITEAFRTQRALFLPEELATIAGPALKDPVVRAQVENDLGQTERALLGAPGAETPAASVARLESRLYLQSQLLRDTDVMAMAHGLEVRTPFVDHELIGTVWPTLGAHPSMMIGKRLLHSTLDRPLPQAVVRHPKQGFTLPFAAWMRGALGPVVQDGMNALAREGWVAPDAPSRVWTEWQNGQVHWSRPWGLALLGAFLTNVTRNARA
jgi:asparagine synthase (glutamine-hydrolysing)